MRAEIDVDKIVADATRRFEASSNKPVVVGWIAAAGAGIITAEWLMHLPLLNALVGFPVQLVGLLITPYLGVRYLMDNEDPVKDVTAVFEKIVSKLPGLE